ncbi:hypothetical protein V6N11_047284 [Hibiscus sabdariffa]|uniref:TF-B3 domain-containing protein n=1 Tax=Hibiscus sabdariffa TaxID=183260 RepID=A0ABR2NCL3_9ROSI
MQESSAGHVDDVDMRFRSYESASARKRTVTAEEKERALPDGRQWSVRYLYKGGKAKFSRRWYEFTLENNLREGDVCVFELLRAGEFVLKVTVFRVMESAGLMHRLHTYKTLKKHFLPLTYMAEWCPSTLLCAFLWGAVLMSSAFAILAKMLKCSFSNVAAVALKANIFDVTSIRASPI